MGLAKWIGRLRPGRVIWCSHEALHAQRLAPFDTAEISRTPLDAIIVTMRVIFGAGQVSGLLAELLEAPDTRNLAMGYRMPHAGAFSTSPATRAC